MFVAVNFHYVRPKYDNPFAGIHGVTPEELERQLMSLASVAPFLSASDVSAAVTGGTPLPERAWFVTFDDGLREQFVHGLPVLDSLGIPAILFPNTAPIETATVASVHKLHLVRATTSPGELEEAISDFAGGRGIDMGESAVRPDLAEAQYPYDRPPVARLKYLVNFVLSGAEREELVSKLFVEFIGEDEAEVSRDLYMSPDQLRVLADRGALGTHAHDHVPLGSLPHEQARDQIMQSMSLLESWTGHVVDALSYPFGSREACVSAAAAAREAGIRWAITMERAVNKDLEEPLLLSRFANNDVEKVASTGSAARAFDARTRRWCAD